MSIEKNQNEIQYPYNLLLALYGKPFDKIVDDDIQKGIDYAFNMLTEREQKCLLMYFRDGMTNEGIGRIFSVTRERIRQVIAKALRKLRHPSMAKYIRNGYAIASDKLKEQVAERYKSEIDRLESEYIMKVEELRQKIAVADNHIKCIKSVIESDDFLRKAEMPIEDCDFSVRTYNALMTHGINTLLKLSQTAPSELKNFRNMGKKSFEEVVKKLSERGLALKGENA